MVLTNGRSLARVVFYQGAPLQSFFKTDTEFGGRFCMCCIPLLVFLFYFDLCFIYTLVGLREYGVWK